MMMMIYTTAKSKCPERNDYSKYRDATQGVAKDEKNRTVEKYLKFFLERSEFSCAGILGGGNLCESSRHFTVAHGDGGESRTPVCLRRRIRRA